MRHILSSFILLAMCPSFVGAMDPFDDVSGGTGMHKSFRFNLGREEQQNASSFSSSISVMDGKITATHRVDFESTTSGSTSFSFSETEQPNGKTTYAWNGNPEGLDIMVRARMVTEAQAAKIRQAIKFDEAETEKRAIEEEKARKAEADAKRVRVARRKAAAEKEVAEKAAAEKAARQARGARRAAAAAKKAVAKKAAEEKAARQARGARRAAAAAAKKAADTEK